MMLFVQAIGYPGSLHVSGAAKLFDKNGRLVNEETRLARTTTWTAFSLFWSGSATDRRSPLERERRLLVMPPKHRGVAKCVARSDKSLDT